MKEKNDEKKVLGLLGTALAAAVLLAGCGLAESDVPYASDMADNMMAGIETGDYAAFSRDFSDTLKEEMDEDAFAALSETLSSTVGAYESKSFYQAADSKKDDVVYTVVVYKAKFSDEDADVLMTVSFSGAQDSKKIEGLFFNSPKLRGE